MAKKENFPLFMKLVRVPVMALKSSSVDVQAYEDWDDEFFISVVALHLFSLLFVQFRIFPVFVFFIQQRGLINHTFADFKSPKVVREVKILFLFFLKIGYSHRSECFRLLTGGLLYLVKWRDCNLLVIP